MVLGKRFIRDDDILSTFYDEDRKRVEVSTGEITYYCYCTEDEHVKAIKELEKRMSNVKEKR